MLHQGVAIRSGGSAKKEIHGKPKLSLGLVETVVLNATIEKGGVVPTNRGKSCISENS